MPTLKATDMPTLDATDMPTPKATDMPTLETTEMPRNYDLLTQVCHKHLKNSSTNKLPLSTVWAITSNTNKLTCSTKLNGPFR